MSRIQLTDSVMDMIIKMAEGNPGAVTAIMQIVEEHDAIDPQSALGGIGAILSLDTLEIYGSDIYVLFSDKCGKDVRKMLMIMRANQLGFLESSVLKNMAADQLREVDFTDEEWKDFDDKVCARLEDFKKAA